MMAKEEILKRLPYAPPFLFVDKLIAIGDDHVEGSYRFDADLPFYAGHFKDHPVTPGVILTECCAQIGLVCLGIYNLNETINQEIGIAFTSAEMEYLLPVYPNETVTVVAKKIYFRFNKLKCTVKMRNEAGKLVCKGTLSGMLKTAAND